MDNKDFTTTILVEQSATAVFNAINNVRGWWQGAINGDSEKLYDEFEYRMKDVHYSKQQVVEFVPNKKIVWLVTDSKLNFSNPVEWTGTKIIFDITDANNKTQVQFTHQGLVSTFECYGGCSWAWGQLIEESLHSLITTGTGKNIFG